LLIKDGKCGEPVALSGTENISMSNLLLEKKVPIPKIDYKLKNGTITGSWSVERGIMSITDAASKIMKLYNNENLRKLYSKNGRKKALQVYDWKIIGEKWNDYMLEVIEK